jgi:hypothetical protein
VPAERLPAFDPAAGPVKLRCRGNRVYGWAYPDGTIEIICRERACRRPGVEVRHLFHPGSGRCVDIDVPVGPAGGKTRLGGEEWRASERASAG